MLITFLLVICVVSLSLIFFCISFYSTCLIDIVLYLCEKEHVEGGMIFQLLEDLTEMSTMRNCEDVFGYIESKQDILGKVCLVFFMLHCFTLGIVESLYVFNFLGIIIVKIKHQSCARFSVYEN